MSNVGWTAVGRENLNPELRPADYKETFNFQPLMDTSVSKQQGSQYLHVLVYINANCDFKCKNCETAVST